MVASCPDCNSTQVAFEDGCQRYCCSACGFMLDDYEANIGDTGTDNENSEHTNNTGPRPQLEGRYRPVFEQLQEKFHTTTEETDFVRQLCHLYLSHPKRVFENSALEVVLCLFYLVVLQHLHDQSMLLQDHCQQLGANVRRCLTIYAALRPIVSKKLATLPSDYDPHHQLDNTMRFLYPALLQSTQSSPTLQHEQQQRPFFSYHQTPFTAFQRNKRNSKGNQQQQQRKRQKVSTSTSSTITTSRSSSPAGIIAAIHSDQPQSSTTASTSDDDGADKLGLGESLFWPTDMDSTAIRQQTARLMRVAKRNGLADGRCGRPLMAACLLVTMVGWYHQDQRQKRHSTFVTPTDSKKRVIPKSRAISLLPVVVIHWDEMGTYQLVNSTTKTRYKEMTALLYSFGKTLPWMKDYLSLERDALHYLDDILPLMDALQTDNHADEHDAPTTSRSPFPAQSNDTTSSLGIETTPSPPSTLDIATLIPPTAVIGPYLPPSFERAMCVRQKRRAELEVFDKWNHARQQHNDTETSIEGSGLTDSVQMVARLITSQQYNREAVLAMSDKDLVTHAYRLTSSSSSSSPSTMNSSALDLDRQLDDFDVSQEELNVYIV